MRRRAEALVLVLVAAAAAAALVSTSGGRGADAQPPVAGAVGWRGLVGSRPRVTLGQRWIVVLKTPSLAQRVARAGGKATDRQERAWTNAVRAAQRLLISRLAVQGVYLRREYSFARVLDGFSALVDSSSIPLIERDPDVAGVYPVRVAYPASLSGGVLSQPDFAAAAGRRAGIGFSAEVDGRGVTIAVLDTGVDRQARFFGDRVQPGIDVVGGDPGARAVPKPDDASDLERHGTEMAGLLVGAGGPGGLAGVAPAATVLPIRVAGWQPDARNHWSVYGRSDQIIAGLDRAVDPNGDGDSHDAARIALVALAEPYAAFTDGPEASAAAGATKLDTLVVAAAGNDGFAGPGFGSIAGPGGAPAALTVGALDLRRQVDEARLVVRSGLDVLVDGDVPLTGAVRPQGTVRLQLAVPRGSGTDATAPRLVDFFDRRGHSLVAGHAALVPAGASPQPAVERAATAGAAAVLLFSGRRLPAGGLGLDESAPVPVVTLSTETAHVLRARLRAGAPVSVSLGRAHTVVNPAADGVASFSSAGLAFDGRVKPELVAPGVGLATADPGENDDGSPRYATVNGTSAAAATVAGAAALLAQARPALSADALKALLVGAARPLAGAPVASAGAGVVDVGAAAAAEVRALPPSLAVGHSTAAGWHARRSFVLENVSTRPVQLRLSVEHESEGAAAVGVTLRPSRLVLPRGARARVVLQARTDSAPVGSQPAEGAVLARVVGGGAIRIPWVIPFGRAEVDLIRRAAISTRAFVPSDTAPTLLVVEAGRVLLAAGARQVRPVRQLDVQLWSAGGSQIGLLARLRDLLPGNYAFGITGRDPTGQVLPPGRYELRLVAHPAGGGRPSRRKLRFTVCPTSTTQTSDLPEDLPGCKIKGAAP
ncbi:MAG TPA: S8 family serine peptidase [Gaiellaceae bacterium]|jgi:subtilisin family serine protease